MQASYYDNTLWGAPPPGMGATMLNPQSASDGVDWGAVITGGIRGAAQGAIGQMVWNAQQSGQLVYQQQQYVQQQQQAQSSRTLFTLLLIGGVIYAVTR